jgi:hypothetical protein
MATVYVLTIHDRHADLDVDVYTDRNTALNRARTVAAEYANHPDDITENTYTGMELHISYSTPAPATGST